jgi:hypothetical protein
MIKKIKNGKTKSIDFRNGYSEINYAQHAETLHVSTNDMREDCDKVELKKVIDLYKKYPVYMSMAEDNHEIYLWLSREDAEELQRYIGEILKEIQTI